ncbi:uncharacterized protein BT62DRAFT_913398 [Guyanagaster necrorhizus]|uniref:Uncharacterized protein n=1 Tax=Guyanagaster necrorhizus TaxID=856835 RepID=A0A9P7VF96_9AGAR|nr:uncharacterized protein BT62DRAFT_913398 [Guyanagaster necrorhizus MCA 3950]KAG7439502.1 hypothetical protein BT62DRAFT_913398 [Guyanagaster necrorhizus MCA 3950]
MAVDGKDGPPITITIDKLHQMMGHISPEAAKRLVKEFLISGIILNETESPKSCD